ncbi:MAG: hypothetical protein ACLFNO_04000 [Parcubacteria group bacterium]
MKKEGRKYIKKTNIFRKPLKKNLSLLRKHIYNYKLEIILSALIIVIIFLSSLLYPNLYLNEANNNDVSVNVDNSNNSEKNIDDYLADIKKDEISDSEANNDVLSEDDIHLNLPENEEEQDEKEQDEEVETAEDLEDFSDAFINSFGDNFSSDVYLNLEKTNMYLDDVSTALTFKPLYNFSKLGSCSGDGISCDFKKNIKILDYGMEACTRNGNDCLKVINEELYYNGRAVTLPNEIRSQDIISLTVGALDTKLLLGAVLANGEDEDGLVYFFNGSTFENIIAKDSKYTIASKYQRQGGRIGFGGSDDNFLIIYSGYNGQVFQVRNGEIIDITNMFGLRVMNKGFMPQIIKSGSGVNSTWYVCSLDKENPKLIKLWQNGSKYIQGSLDLTYKIFTTSALYDNFNHCYLSNNDDRKLYLTFNNKNSLDIWQFQDNGFDNSHDYSAISSDIINKEGLVAKNAIIKEIDLSVREKTYTSNIEDYGALYLSTNNINWQKVTVNEFLYFEENTSDLYWRLDLKKGDQYFSPWFDSISPLNYLSFEKN